MFWLLSIVTVKPFATTVSPLAGNETSPSHVNGLLQFPVATAPRIAMPRSSTRTVNQRHADPRQRGYGFLFRQSPHRRFSRPSEILQPHSALTAEAYRKRARSRSAEAARILVRRRDVRGGVHWRSFFATSLQSSQSHAVLPRCNSHDSTANPAYRASATNPSGK